MKVAAATSSTKPSATKIAKDEKKLKQEQAAQNFIVAHSMEKKEQEQQQSNGDTAEIKYFTRTKSTDSAIASNSISTSQNKAIQMGQIAATAATTTAVTDMPETLTHAEGQPQCPMLVQAKTEHCNNAKKQKHHSSCDKVDIRCRYCSMQLLKVKLLTGETK